MLLLSLLVPTAALLTPSAGHALGAPARTLSPSMAFGQNRQGGTKRAAIKRVAKRAFRKIVPKEVPAHRGRWAPKSGSARSSYARARYPGA